MTTSGGGWAVVVHMIDRSIVMTRNRKTIFILTLGNDETMKVGIGWYFYLRDSFCIDIYALDILMFVIGVGINMKGGMGILVYEK